MSRETIGHKPKIRLSSLHEYKLTEKSLSENGLHSICESGMCPNKRECWGRGTATFMILGSICTRACKFCGVTTGRPLPPDLEEPVRVAQSIRNLSLKHVVITSVDRDDLPDHGASSWARTIEAIRNENRGITIETLIPDFNAREELLDVVVGMKPEIVSHNLETVQRLTPAVRSVATYERSLGVLGYLSDRGLTTKSGIMLGLGETMDEVESTMDDLLNIGCKILTMGQYLQPSKKHLPVFEMIPLSSFERLKQKAVSKGFKHVESGPLVRSSYHAEMQVNII